MHKKITFFMGALAVAAGFTAVALANSSNGPLRVEGEEEPEVIVYTPPVVFYPTIAQMEQCHVYNLNDDTSTWKLEYDGGVAAFKYNYNSTNAADDWCILPIMQMTPGSYRITYTYRTSSNSDRENFKILFGQGWEYENYTQVLLEKELYANTSYVTESSMVTITEAGEYHVALYAWSDRNKYHIYIRDITVELIPETKPEIPEVTVTSTGLEGIMSITLPSETVYGEALTGTINATITDDDEIIGEVSGNPGAVVEQELNVEARGEHTYTIVASREIDGETISSDPVKVNHLFTRILPNPLPLGYIIEPDEDEFNACTVINHGETEKTWGFYKYSSQTNKEYPTAFRYLSSYYQPANDWLILPAYEGVDTGAAMLHFLIGTESYKENIEIGVAHTPDVEALAENIIWKEEDYITRGVYETVEVDFGATNGEPIYVGFHCTSPSSRGYVYLQGITVKPSSPLVPKAAQIEEINFDGGNGTIKVILPTENITDETIEGTVYVDVALDGEPFGQPLAGTAGEEKILTFEGLERGSHTLNAVSYILVDDEVRLDGKSVSVEFKIKRGSTDIFTPPCTLIMDEEMAEEVKIVDVNNDNSTWGYYYDSTGECIRMKYDSSNAADDWLILPAIQVNNVTASYKITVTAKCNSSTWPEKMEVYIGQEQDIDAMTLQVMEPTVVDNSNWIDYEGEVMLPEPGNYYIGIHGISDANMYFLSVQKVAMECTDPSVGIATAKAINGKVTGLNGAILLNGFDGEQVRVMNMAGQTINNVKSAEAAQRILVPAGIYLVKAGERTFKVVVK